MVTGDRHPDCVKVLFEFVRLDIPVCLQCDNMIGRRRILREFIQRIVDRPFSLIKMVIVKESRCVVDDLRITLRAVGAHRPVNLGELRIPQHFGLHKIGFGELSRPQETAVNIRSLKILLRKIIEGIVDLLPEIILPGAFGIAGRFGTVRCRSLRLCFRAFRFLLRFCRRSGFVSCRSYSRRRLRSPGTAALLPRTSGQDQAQYQHQREYCCTEPSFASFFFPVHETLFSLSFQGPELIASRHSFCPFRKPPLSP